MHSLRNVMIDLFKFDLFAFYGKNRHEKSAFWYRGTKIGQKSVWRPSVFPIKIAF